MFENDVDNLVEKIDEIVDTLEHKDGRCMAIARTKLQEARMWVTESMFENPSWDDAEELDN